MPHRFFREWHAHHVVLQDAEEDANVEPIALDKSVLHELADTIRSWAFDFATGSVDVEGNREVALEYVRWLDGLAASLHETKAAEESWQKSNTRGGYWNSELQSHGQYEKAFLLQCLQIAFENMHFEGTRNKK